MSILTVAQWMGHSATKVTELYAHVIADVEPVGFMTSKVNTSAKGRVGTSSVPKRAQIQPTENAGSAKSPTRRWKMERETGLEPATLSLGS